MSNITDIRLSGTTYQLIDATAIHSLDGYYTTGETNAAITAATDALAQAIAEQGYQTSGDVQNAISGKANSDDVYTKQETEDKIDEKIAEASGVTTGQVQTMIDESISGKADASVAVNDVSFIRKNDGSELLYYLTRKSGTYPSAKVLGIGTGLTLDVNTQLKVDFTKVAKPSDIPSVTGYADSVLYDTISKEMKFYHGGTGGTEVFGFDASPFLIDGMVQNVEIKDVEISGETVTCLVISFNTDAGKQDINIPLTDIFDASNYYTKDEVDAELSAKTDNSAFTAYTAATDTALGNKADTTAMTEAISEATSGKVDTNTYTAYTAATDTVIAGKANTGDVVTDVSVGSRIIEGRNIYQIIKTIGGIQTSLNYLIGGSGITLGDSRIISVDTNTIQEKLVSNTNIKTVGGNSLLGSGDIAFPAGLQVQVSGTTLIFQS